MICLAASQTIISAAEMIKYFRLVSDLRDILKGDTISLEKSKEVIAKRLNNREKNFLSLVQKGVYQNPKSPSLKLVKIAGCEFRDI